MGRGEMVLDCTICTVRSWRSNDDTGLARVADNPNVSRYLTDAFPSPYTLHDARVWLDLNAAIELETHFAIEVAGRVAGGIGYTIHAREERVSADMGYWLGEEYWGQGIATAALRRLTDYAFERHDLRRIAAVVMHPNLASARVLEKSGYVREGVMRNAVVKGSRVLDLLLYAAVR